MSPDFSTDLPSEITTNILSRLPIRRVAISKCVCKPWLHLLETDHFVKSHFAKSAPALALTVPSSDSNWLYVCELEEDGLDLGRRYDPLTGFNFSREAKLRASADIKLLPRGSANGLLLLCTLDDGNTTFYICNPIIREFCLFHSPYGDAYGFGVSRISGQYKVLSIDDKKGWYVYTLGTGSWRRVEATVPFDCSIGDGLFVHGNLHWVVSSDTEEWIYCFDLETECFSRFALPPRRNKTWRLYILRDSLSFCDRSSDGDGIAIWMMKEYGDEKSWSMEYAITLNLDLHHNDGVDEFIYVEPAHVFNNGDVLMLCCGLRFMYYSNKTKTSQVIRGFFDPGEEFYRLNACSPDIGGFYDMYLIVVTPSMLSLKCFSDMENVISF